MANPHAKTIQIFLPTGEPRGIRIADFTIRTVQAILVPRSELRQAKIRPDNITNRYGDLLRALDAALDRKPDHQGASRRGEAEDAAAIAAEGDGVLRERVSDIG